MHKARAARCSSRMIRAGCEGSRAKGRAALLERDEEGRFARGKFLIYSSGFAPERVISAHFVTSVVGAVQCRYQAVGWMEARPSSVRLLPTLLLLLFLPLLLSAPGRGDARGAREMELEESDFLVFKPLGQKMTYRTISAEAIQTSGLTAPFSLRFS